MAHSLCRIFRVIQVAQVKILLTHSYDDIATGVGLVNAGLEFVSLGAVSQPIRKALIKNATFIIMSHNHPGGSLEP